MWPFKFFLLCQKEYIFYLGTSARWVVRNTLTSEQLTNGLQITFTDLDGKSLLLLKFSLKLEISFSVATLWSEVIIVCLTLVCCHG